VLLRIAEWEPQSHTHPWVGVVGAMTNVEPGTDLCHAEFAAACDDRIVATQEDAVLREVLGALVFGFGGILLLGFLLKVV